ncbi:MAG: tetratricopeptide repeat protein [Candidatus Omnitrophica bacterium]|nr:tetratricopeptide repeat protein [Candidatus Omnitrophota bacterium]
MRKGLIVFVCFFTVSTCAINLSVCAGDNRNDSDAQREQANQYYMKGNDLFTEKNYNDAITEYNKVIKLDPEHIYACYQRGASYFNIGGYEKEAIRDSNKVIALDPDYESGVAYGMRGGSYYALGEYRLAIMDYDEALKRGLDDALIHADKGTAFLNLGDYESAFEVYKRVLALNPGGRVEKIVRKNLEILAVRLKEKKQNPKSGVLTDQDMNRLNEFEKVWATNLDAASEAISKENFSSADRYIDESLNAVQGMRQLLIDRDLDHTKAKRLDAMEMMTMAHANLEEIAIVGQNPINPKQDISEIADLFIETNEYLKDAAYLFDKNDAVTIADECRRIKNGLKSIIKNIERKSGRKIL